MQDEELVNELEASGLRGRGGAGFSMGKKASFIPQGHDGQVPLLQRGRVRARHVQGPPADAEEPAPPDRGHHHRRARRGREPGVHLHPRRVRAPGADPREGRRGGESEGLRRRAHPRLGLLARAVGPPRPGRVHLRRGVGAARRARGQARQPAAEAAVPREPGPLPGPDADQQRRDALQRPADRREGRGLVQVVRHREVDRHEAGVGLRQRAAAGQLRDRARHHRARHRLRPGGRSARGTQGEVLVPGRLVGAGAARGGPRPARTTSSTWPRPARCSARARSS